MTKIMKKQLLRLITICAAALISGVSALKAEPIELDLKEAINVALEKNEAYKIAQKELEKANGQVTEAVAGALPQITGGLTYLKNWVVPTGVFQMNGETVTFKFGTDNSYTANLTLTQPLYAGGRTITALGIARNYKKMARKMVFSAGQDLKVQVFNSFYAAVLAEEVYRVNQESYDLAKENLDVVEKMYNQGMAAEFDYLRARVAVANLEPDVIKARNDSDLAMSALKNTLGLDLDSEIELDAVSDSTEFILQPISHDEAIAELKLNRPEVTVSSLETKMRKQMISIAKAGYRPSLIFSSSLQYQSQFNNGNVFDKKWDRSLNSVLMLSVPIFDSWKTPSQVKQARAEMVQSRLREESTVKYMILDYEQSQSRYNEARTRYSVQGGAVELARRGLDIANVRYENGVGTQLEVSDARLSLARAEINRALAFHDLATSYASLLRSLGRDVEPSK